MLDIKLEHLSEAGVEYFIKDFDIEAYKFPESVTSQESLEEAKIIKKKYIEFLEEIIAQEIKLLKESKLYNSYSSYWVTSEVYIPLSKRTINVAPSNSTAFEEKEFKDWRVGLGLNYLMSNKNNVFIGIS